MRQRILGWLGERIQDNRALVIVLTLLAFTWAIYWVATGHLAINTSRHGLVNEDDPAQVRLMDYHDRFGAANDVAVVFELPQDSPDARINARQVIEHVGDALRSSKSFHQVFYRVDLRPDANDSENTDALGTRALLYLPHEYFEKIQRNLEFASALPSKGKPAGHTVNGLVEAATGIVDGLDEIDANDGTIEGLDGEASKALRSLHPVDVYPALDMMRHTADELRHWIDEPTRTELGFEPDRPKTSQGFNLDSQGYVISGDGQLYMLKLSITGDAVDYKVAHPALTELRTIVADAVAQAQPLEWGITGVPVSVTEEREAIEEDLPLTTIISTIGCLLVFLVAYRSVRMCAVAFLPVLVGVVIALGLTAVFVGSLNLLTSPCFVILIGMGIDFAIHLITRIREERRLGAEPRVATQTALRETGPAILTGAITSAVAFAALAFTDLKATSELGITTAMGLSAVLIATLVLVPLLLGNSKTAGGKQTETVRSQMPVFVKTRRVAWATLIGVLAVTAGLIWMIRPIHFEFDINEYLPEDAHSIAVLEKLTEHGVAGIEYGVLQAKTLEEASEQRAKLQALSETTDLIDRVASILDVMPEDLESKRAVVAKFRTSNVPSLNFQTAPQQPAKEFVDALDTLRTPPKRPAMGSFRLDLPYIVDKNFNWSGSEDCQTTADCACAPDAEGCHRGLVCAEIPTGERRCTLDKAPFEALQVAVDQLHTSASAAAEKDEDGLRGRLDAFEQQAQSVSKHLNKFLYKDDLDLKPTDLPQSIRSTFYIVDEQGKEVYATRVYPRNFIDPIQAHKLVDALTAIDAEATGYALVYHHFGELMQRGFRNGAIWASIAVLLLILLDLRNVRDALLALVPLVFGGLWMVGFMNLLGIDYSFANVISIPLIVGIGIDSGIHLIHRWRETNGDIHEAVRTSGKAIAVSSVTTMFAFGTLSLVAHRGAQSLGLALVLGVGSCLIMSLLLLPALIQLLGVQPKTATSH